MRSAANRVIGCVLQRRAKSATVDVGVPFYNACDLPRTPLLRRNKSYRELTNRDTTMFQPSRHAGHFFHRTRDHATNTYRVGMQAYTFYQGKRRVPSGFFYPFLSHLNNNRLVIIIIMIYVQCNSGRR
jgi:hypothetical protein